MPKSLTSRPRSLADTNATASGHAFILVLRAAGLALAPLRHRFLWHLSKYLGRMLTSRERYATMRVGSDSVFRFYLDDPYWNRLLVKTFSYEEELAVVLARTKDLDFAFVDCGANFGYWSVLASGAEAGAHEVLAIEASPQTFTALRENCRLNDHRFTILNAGVSSETGATVEVSKGRSHAGAHIGEPTLRENRIGVVETITIDDALLRTFGQMPRRILLKLDVEGAEIRALQGSRSALTRDCLICYEDHGKDRANLVSAHVMDTLGLQVFFVRHDGSVTAMRSLDDVSRIKMEKIMGTNFFACRPDSAFLPGFDEASRHRQGSPAAI